MQTYVTIHALVQYQDKFLILKRASHRFNPGYWNCVTGHIKEYESVEEAVSREVLEETGLNGTIIRVAKPFVLMSGEKRWITQEDEIVTKYKGIKDTLKLLEILDN